MKNPKQIHVSEILAHVLKHREPFPIPDGTYTVPHSERAFQIVQDITNCGLDGFIRESDFTTISKAEFGRKHCCAPAQVSRWVKAGLPVRTDGRLNHRAADHWLECYQLDCERRKANGWQSWNNSIDDIRLGSEGNALEWASA
jgi:hypothetical protein